MLRADPSEAGAISTVGKSRIQKDGQPFLGLGDYYWDDSHDVYYVVF